MLNEKRKKRKKRKERNKKNTTTLPDDIDYCEKCNFAGETCRCRFELLTLWFEVYAIGNALTTEMCSPAAIRYKQYRYCSQMTHGFLGKGRRVKPATCITEGLHTMYPNPVGVDHVGFRKKPKVEKKEEQA
jgi:hypothetical protein